MRFVKEEPLNTYAAHMEAGVMIKTVVDGRNCTVLYAKSRDVAEYFECKIDSHGNVCDAEGTVVFPSCSGKYPAKKGDVGYFGFFRENFGPDHHELPSINDDVYSHDD